jgi:hypothetical protein
MGNVCVSIRKTGKYVATPPSKDLLVQEKNVNLATCKFLMINFPDDERVKQFTLDLLMNSNPGPALTDGSKTLAEFLPEAVGQRVWAKHQSTIGGYVSRWYKNMYDTPLKKTNKYCNGQQRLINMYPHELHDEIITFSKKLVEVEGW